MEMTNILQMLHIIAGYAHCALAYGIIKLEGKSSSYRFNVIAAMANFLAATIFQLIKP